MPFLHRSDTAAEDSVRRSGRRRLMVIGALFLATNIGFSFFFMSLGTILLGRGVPLATVAAVNLLGAVYFGRFLVAPLIDRSGIAHLGHYRGWLIVTQIALIATLAALAPLDPGGDLAAVLALVGVMLVLSVLHDVALNGLVVRLIPAAEFGAANGVITASASASMLVGSGGALLLYARAGWTVTVMMLAAVYVIALVVLLRLSEPTGPTPHRRDPLCAQLVDYFRRPRAAVWTLLVIPLFGVAEWLISAVQPAMLLTAGWSTDHVAVSQTVTIGCQILAGLAAGSAISRCGHRRSALAIGVGGVAAGTAALPLAAGHTDAVLTTAAMVALSVVYVAKLTWFSVLSMDSARAAHASTDYTVPMSVEGVCVTLAGSAGLALAAAAGFVWLTAAAVALAAAGTVVAVVWMRGSSNKPAAPNQSIDSQG